MFDNKYHFVRLSSCKYLRMHAKPLELHVAYFQQQQKKIIIQFVIQMS